MFVPIPVFIIFFFILFPTISYIGKYIDNQKVIIMSTFLSFAFSISIIILLFLSVRDTQLLWYTLGTISVVSIFTCILNNKESK